MGKRKYPPLKLSEVRAIVEALGFTVKKTSGSHCQYEGMGASGERALVTVDLAIAEFDDTLIKSMIGQSCQSREILRRDEENSAQDLGNARSRLHRIQQPNKFFQRPNVHKTLRVTPAMEAGLADHIFKLHHYRSVATDLHG